MVPQRVVDRLPREVLLVRVDDRCRVLVVPLGRLRPDVVRGRVAVEHRVREVKAGVGAGRG